MNKLTAILTIALLTFSLQAKAEDTCLSLFNGKECVVIQSPQDVPQKLETLDWLCTKIDDHEISCENKIRSKNVASVSESVRLPDECEKWKTKEEVDSKNTQTLVIKSCVKYKGEKK